MSRKSNVQPIQNKTTYAVINSTGRQVHRADTRYGAMTWIRNTLEYDSEKDNEYTIQEIFSARTEP